ncbi:MAG: response regulator [Bryobacteraceae bacterium]
MTKVLIADDRAASRELIRTVLEADGYEVEEAVDGLDAVLCAQECPPALIILDLQMPRLNGFEALERLRQDRRFWDTPVMALTASAMNGDRERAIAAGFTSYITKPVSLTSLRSELKRLLETGALRAALG